MESASFSGDGICGDVGSGQRLNVLAFILLAVIASVSCCSGGAAECPASDVDAGRLQPTNIRIVPLGEFDGHGRAVRFVYPADATGKDEGWVYFGGADLGLPCGDWIPPFVGRRARSIAYSVLLRTVGRDRVFLKWNKSQRDVGRETLLAEEKWETNRWNEVRHDFALEPDERIARLTLDVVGRDAAEFVLADLRLVLDDGSEFALLNSALPSYLTAGEKSCAREPARKFPQRLRIQFGVSASWVVRHADEIPALSDFMRTYLPEHDIVLSLDGSPEPMVAEIMRTAPDNIYFQMQKGSYAIRYLGLRDALIRNAKGCPQPGIFNSVHGCSPLVREALRDQIAYAGSLGFNNVQQFDYTWYYPDGPWGFDRMSAEAFREDLTQTDEGLALGATGSVPERTIHFWDYYEDYQGAGARLAPADLGLSDWNEFRPRFETDRQQTLHWMLVSYEWLRQAQRFGAWSRRYCFGQPHDFLLNWEGTVNGNDHIYLMRLKDTGIVSPEYFIDTVKTIGVLYRNTGRWVREARRYGKKCGLTLETSTGGGSTQAYWSCKTGYVVSYVLSALGLESFEYDHVPDGASWAAHTNRIHVGLWKNLALGMSEARGYRQAKIDGAAKPKFSGVLHLHGRTVARGGESWSFADSLVRSGVDYEWTDEQELRQVSEKARVIVVSPTVTRRDTLAFLEAWRKAVAGRAVVVGQGDVETIAKAVDLPRLQVNASEDVAFALPFDCGSFQVAALFNRDAARQADRKAWERNVLPKVYRRQTFDEAQLLYSDTSAVADAGATIRVPSPGVYRLYSVLTEREWVVAADQGLLRLPLGNRLCDLVYYGLDGENFRDRLTRIKEDVNVTSEFF